MKRLRDKSPVIKLINTHQAKTTLSRLVKEVEEKGTLIRICRNGKPVAELRPIEQDLDPLKLHPEISKVKFLADPTEPVDDDDWPEELR